MRRPYEYYPRIPFDDRKTTLHGRKSEPVVREILDVLKESGGTLVAINPLPETKNGSDLALPLEIHAIGRTESMHRFLYLLEKSAYCITEEFVAFALRFSNVASSEATLIRYADETTPFPRMIFYGALRENESLAFYENTIRFAWRVSTELESIPDAALQTKRTDAENELG